MFDKSNRYMTKGVNIEIPLELQLFMWNCIDELKGKGQEVDYLQVFELRDISNAEKFNQEIIHSQEIPSYKKCYLVASSKPINEKVFVIDDSQQSVMMKSSEY